MGLLKVILPKRIADMVPVEEREAAQPAQTLAPETRRVVSLNCALLLALFGLGTVAATLIDSDELCLEVYRHFLVFVGQWYQLDPEANSSMIVFWVCMSLLSWAVCIVPLYVLALSDFAAFIASALAAPVIGFWLTMITMQWLGAVSSVHAGMAIAICGLLFLAGYRGAAVILGAMVLAILHPWTYINWHENMLGSVAMYAVIFPGYTAFVLLKKISSVLEMGASGMNESNVPVVIFSLLAMAASFFFVSVIARALIFRRKEPSTAN